MDNGEYFVVRKFHLKNILIGYSNFKALRRNKKELYDNIFLFCKLLC